MKKFKKSNEENKLLKSQILIIQEAIVNTSCDKNENKYLKKGFKKEQNLCLNRIDTIKRMIIKIYYKHKKYALFFNLKNVGLKLGVKNYKNAFIIRKTRKKLMARGAKLR